MKHLLIIGIIFLAAQCQDKPCSECTEPTQEECDSLYPCIPDTIKITKDSIIILDNRYESAFRIDDTGQVFYNNGLDTIWFPVQDQTEFDYFYNATNFVHFRIEIEEDTLIPPVDTDGDGIIDADDVCPNQGDIGYGLQANGCPVAAPTGNEPLIGATYTTLWNNDYSQMGWVTAIEGEGNITLGSTDIIRSPNTKCVHYKTSGKRSELHSARNFLGVKEGDIVYFGWSDYYVNFSLKPITIFQWRDIDIGYSGCPNIRLMIYGSYWDLGNINGIAAAIKIGRAGRAAILRDMEKNTWYDFVIGMKYAKDETGFFKMWAGEAGTLNYDNPVYSYQGATMFNISDLGTDRMCDYPFTDGLDHFHQTQLRMGGCYQMTPYTEFESYKGPLRINIGEDSKTAFLKTIPR